MSQKAPDLPQPDTAQPHKAGDAHAIPGGRITYLAPSPLPTTHEALDLNGTISNLNDVWLDVGGGYMDAFGWQLLTGGTFTLLLLLALFIPSLAWIMMPGTSFGFMWDVYKFGFWAGLAGGLFFWPCIGATGQGLDFCGIPPRSLSPPTPRSLFCAGGRARNGDRSLGITDGVGGRGPWCDPIRRPAAVRYGVWLRASRDRLVAQTGIHDHGKTPGHQPLGSHPCLHGVRGPFTCRSARSSGNEK